MAEPIEHSAADLMNELQHLRRERDVLQKICARRADVLEAAGLHADATVDEAKALAIDLGEVQRQRDALVKALERMTLAFKPFTMRPIGGEGSAARMDQQEQIEAHAEARATLDRVGSPSVEEPRS